MPDSAVRMEKSSISWFDSHCHLDFGVFDGEREQLWQRARQAGVWGLIIPGITVKQSLALASINQPDCFFCQGIHPYFLDASERRDLDKLSDMLRHSKAIALGEIGIDNMLIKKADNPQQEKQSQWQFFRAQVDIAIEQGLPLVLHIRGAHDEVASYLRQQGFQQGGVVHAFSGSEQQAKRWLDLGFKLGIGGAMTFSRAVRLRRTVQQLPLDALLLETDAPDMRPAFLAQQYNSPEIIPLYGYFLASLRGQPAEVVAQQLQKNLTDVFATIKYSAVS